MITDKKAEELEQRGLWRRAAARWQELLLNYLQEDDRYYYLTIGGGNEIEKNITVPRR